MAYIESIPNRHPDSAEGVRIYRSAVWPDEVIIEIDDKHATVSCEEVLAVVDLVEVLAQKLESFASGALVRVGSEYYEKAYLDTWTQMHGGTTRTSKELAYFARENYYGEPVIRFGELEDL